MTPDDALAWPEYDLVATWLAAVRVYGDHLHWWSGTWPPMSMACWGLIDADPESFERYVNAHAYALAMRDVMEEL